MSTTPSPPSRSEPAADAGDDRVPAAIPAVPHIPHGAPGTVRLVIRDGEAIHESTDLADLAPALGGGRWVWIDATAPSPAQVNEIGQVLGLHALIAEDILEGNQRPKIEVTESLVHVVMFAIRYVDVLDASEVDFVLGDHFLLSVHEPGWNPRGIHQMRGGLAAITGRGPDHLLWALVDSIVDAYFPCMDRIGDQIDELQDEVIERASRPALQRLFLLKRDLLAMRRVVSPVREIFNQLTNRELALIDADEIIYFRDVYDHLIRITDEVDTHRELVSGTLEVYLTTVNNNLSLIMKRLTGVTVIVAGVGAVAGIFGMSEAALALSGGEGSGFWIVTVVTVIAAGVAAVFLRRIGWI